MYVYSAIYSSKEHVSECLWFVILSRFKYLLIVGPNLHLLFHY